MAKCRDCREERRQEELLYNECCLPCLRVAAGACEWCGGYNCPYLVGADCPELMRLQEGGEADGSSHPPKERTMTTHSDHGNKCLYDNGCLLCDAILSLRHLIDHGADVPWADEDFENKEMAKLVHYIRTGGQATE